MRSTEIPTSKAKLKLLNAAETQVAQRGFDAVSVRDITQKAKANVAAVNYHFGSREGMMGLLMARRMSPIHEAQLKNLNLSEKKRGSKPVPLEELLDAWLRPLFVHGAADGSGDDYLPLSVARILALPVDSLPEPLQQSGLELWQRYLRAFGKCLKEVPADEIAWRLHLLNGAATQALSGTDAVGSWIGKVNAKPDGDLALSQLLRLAAPMMRESGVMKNDVEKPKAPQSTFDF